MVVVVSRTRRWSWRPAVQRRRRLVRAAVHRCPRWTTLSDEPRAPSARSRPTPPPCRRRPPGPASRGCTARRRRRQVPRRLASTAPSRTRAWSWRRGRWAAAMTRASTWARRGSATVTQPTSFVRVSVSRPSAQPTYLLTFWSTSVRLGAESVFSRKRVRLGIIESKERRQRHVSWILTKKRKLGFPSPTGLSTESDRANKARQPRSRS